MRIEVVSDVICPWCFVGKRRLEKALDLLGARATAEVVWRPFELNPGMPGEGMPRRAYREAKFGSWERSLALEAHVREAGEQEGIAFHFDRIERTPNTFAAHSLIHAAGEAGQQDAVVEALFRAYFVDGRNVGDPSVLEEIAAEHAIPQQRDNAVVSAMLAQARARGISGVPAFFRDGVFVASGAQPPAMLADSLRSPDGASGFARIVI